MLLTNDWKWLGFSKGFFLFHKDNCSFRKSEGFSKIIGSNFCCFALVMIENGLDFPSFYFMKITAVLESLNDFLKFVGSNFCCFALLMIGNGFDFPMVSFYFMTITAFRKSSRFFKKLHSFLMQICNTWNFRTVWLT